MAATITGLFTAEVSEYLGTPASYHNDLMFIVALICQVSQNNLLLLVIPPLYVWNFIWNIVVWSIYQPLGPEAWLAYLGTATCTVLKIAIIVFSLVVYKARGGTFNGRELMSQMKSGSSDNSYGEFPDEQGASHPGSRQFEDNQGSFENSQYSTPPQTYQDA